MADKRLRRKEMVENRSRLYNFCLTSGRDLFQDVLELETSPALVFNKLINSDYYRTLSESEKESYLFLKNQNTFSEIELEQAFELLKRFTSVKQPKCLWCGKCSADSLQSESIEECLELVMSIWNILQNSNFFTNESYITCVSTLQRIGYILSKKCAFGKSFLEKISREIEDTGHIHILSYRGDMNVLIGNNNKSVINVEVFDHLPKEKETTDMEDDYLKLIIHLQSPSVIDVARIEERMLLALSGEQLQEINRILEKKFGLRIVVARKGCIVLVIEKNELILNSVQDTNILEEFLSQLLIVIGFSFEDLSEIDISVDITKGDAMDKAFFKELNKKKKGFEIIVGPRKIIESMSEERRKEFVTTILSEVKDQGDWDRNGDIKIQADFTFPTNESKNAIGGETLHEGSKREHAYVCDRLTSDQRYRVRVACCKVAGGVKFFEPCGAVVPGQCQAPKLQGRPKATYLHIRWAYPDYDGGAAVSEYAVQMVTPDKTSREVYRGRDLDCIVAELSPGRPYLFQVRAFNRIGGGGWSDPFEVVSGAGVPDPPKAPQVTCKSPYSAIVSWEPPVNNGATITEYRLEWQQKTEVTDFTMLYTGPNQSYEIRGLTPATLYLFRVQAINSIGQGPYSPLETYVTQPSSPSSVTIHRHTSTDTSITLFWKEPNSNGSDITAYNLEVGDKHFTIGAVTKYTIETLKPETVHKIRVQAVNAIGMGPFSTPVWVRPRALPTNTSNLECIASTPNSLQLKWGDQRDLDTNHYTLEMEKEDRYFQVIYEGSSHFFKVKQLQESTNYNFRIYASNDVEKGPYSEVYTFSTTKAPPPAVRDLRVSNLCQQSCSVEWQPCEAIQGSSVEYVLQLQGQQEYQEIHRGEDTSFQVESLAPKTDYHLRIFAIRIYEDGSEVTGPFSPVVTFTTQGHKPLFAQEADIKQESKLLERKQLTDQQWAMITLMGFVVFAVLVSFVVQQIIKY